MRRSDREVKDREQIYDIMRRCDSMALALFDGDYPYVIEMNFGFEVDGDRVRIFFHGAKEGKKLELIAQNPHAAFSMSCGHELILGKVDCATTFKYESVCGRGIIHMAEGAEKTHALSVIMRHFDPENPHEFDERHAAAVSVFSMDVQELTGKRRLVK